MDKDGLIYNPPAWRVCPECNGKGERWTGQFNDRGYVGKCQYCNGTGRIPIRYTPDEWIKAGGVLSDYTNVWVLISDRWSEFAHNYRMFRENSGTYKLIIAIPGQDRPDDNWRPE